MFINLHDKSHAEIVKIFRNKAREYLLEPSPIRRKNFLESDMIQLIEYLGSPIAYKHTFQIINGEIVATRGLEVVNNPFV